jgi:hypothetical protein
MHPHCCQQGNLSLRHTSSNELSKIYDLGRKVRRLHIYSPARIFISAGCSHLDCELLALCPRPECELVFKEGK